MNRSTPHAIRALLALSCIAFALSACDDGSSSDAAAETLVHTRPDYGVSWNQSIVYGLMKDARDGQVYRTVKIGNQTWMAENLSYRSSGTDTGSCYTSHPDSCAKYGRHYTWETAMGGSASSAREPSGVQGVCPAGWHVPSIAEFDTLVAFVERNPAVGTAKGGNALKNKGWSTQSTDLFGFRALPAGYQYANGSYLYVGVGGGWWSATQDSPSSALRRDLGSYNDVYRGGYEKTGKFTVRCLRD